MPDMDGYDTMRAIRQTGAVPRPADHRRDRQGDEGRPREDASRPAPGTTSPSRSTPTRCCRCCGPGCAADVRHDGTVDGDGSTSSSSTTTPAKLLALRRCSRSSARTSSRPPPGREALRLLLQHEFAVILLDVNMPDMDGFETAALIRQRKSSEHTPIIFVTAYARRDARRARLLARRGGLHPRAGRARGAAHEGRGLRRPVPEDRAGRGGRPSRSSAAPTQLQQLTRPRWRSTPRCRSTRLLQVVADSPADILGARQAVAVARPSREADRRRGARRRSRRVGEAGGERRCCATARRSVAALDDRAAPCGGPAATTHRTGDAYHAADRRRGRAGSPRR